MTTPWLRFGSVCALAAGFMTLGPTPAPAAEPGQREVLEAAGLSDAPPPSGQTVPVPRTVLGAGVDLLLIPDSTADRVMAFDPTTGNLVDANFIPADVTNLSTPKHAFAHADGASVLVIDQLDDLVQRYDGGDGAYIGAFAPAGGVNTAVLDNATGGAYRPGGGNLVVCVQSGGNANSVAEFDSNGIFVNEFIGLGSGGLAGPFDVYFRAADVLVSSINTDQILRYDLAGGFLGVFAAVNNFPQQIAEAANGNVLVANFGGTQVGVIEFTAGRRPGGRLQPARGRGQPWRLRVAQRQHPDHQRHRCVRDLARRGPGRHQDHRGQRPVHRTGAGADAGRAAGLQRGVTGALPGAGAEATAAEAVSEVAAGAGPASPAQGALALQTEASPEAKPSQKKSGAGVSKIEPGICGAPGPR